MGVVSTAVPRVGNPNLCTVDTEELVAQKLKYRAVTGEEKGLVLTTGTPPSGSQGKSASVTYVTLSWLHILS